MLTSLWDGPTPTPGPSDSPTVSTGQTPEGQYKNNSFAQIGVHNVKPKLSN